MAADCNTTNMKVDDVHIDKNLRILELEEQAVFYGTIKHRRHYILPDRVLRLKELLVPFKGKPKQSKCSIYVNSKLSECRPCSVKVVDCCKYPWAYENKSKRKLNMRHTEEKEVVEHIEPLKVFTNNNADKRNFQNVCKNKIKINADKRFSNIVNRKVCKNNLVQNTVFRGEQEPVLLKRVHERTLCKAIAELCEPTNDLRKRKDDAISRPLYDNHKSESPQVSTTKTNNDCQPDNSQNIMCVSMTKINNKNILIYLGNGSSLKCKARNRGRQTKRPKHNGLNNRKQKNENHKKNEIHIQLSTPLTDRVSPKFMNEMILLYGCQKQFYNCKQIIPHFHDHPCFGKVANSRKVAKNTTKTSERTHENHMAQPMNYCGSMETLNCGPFTEILDYNNKTDDENFIGDCGLNTGDRLSANNGAFEFVAVTKNEEYAYTNMNHNVESGNAYSQNSAVDNLMKTRTKLCKLWKGKLLNEVSSNSKHESIYSPLFFNSMNDSFSENLTSQKYTTLITKIGSNENLS